MIKKICLGLVLFFSFSVFYLNVNATTYKCTYEFNASNNTGKHSRVYEGYFDVDTVSKKIIPQEKYWDWSPKYNTVLLLDPIFDKTYDESETIKKFNNNCPDKVYACVGQEIVLQGNANSITMFLLNGSLMDKIEYGKGFSFGDMLYGISDENKCATGTYLEDKSTAPSIHVEFECTNFTKLWEEYDSKYCDISSKDCDISRVSEYKEAKNKLKEYCRNKLRYSNTFDPCTSECIKLAERISEKEGATDTNGQCGFSGKLIIFIANIVKWGKYLIPVAVIILSILDFIKAISSEKEDEMKKAQGNFVKRLVIAALIFILPFIIEFILDKIGFDAKGCGIIDL